MALPNPAFHTDAQRRYIKDPDGGWSLGMHPEATAEHLLAMRAMLQQHEHVAAAELRDLPGYTGDMGPLRIDNARAPNPVRPRRHSPRDEEFSRSKVQEMLDAGIIRPSQSTRYACEYTCAAKKDEHGEWSDLRFCNDFRPLNDETPLDLYPLPRPDDIFMQLGEARFFSKLDLKAGFNQVPVAEEDVEKTAFWCAGQKYEYVRMPFGLKNAPIHFQRIMDFELDRHGLRGFVRCFIDDLIIYSRSPEEHIQHVQRVLRMLDACNLRFHPSKSVFLTDSVEYLGHFVGPVGLSPAGAKVQAIQAMPAPQNVDDIRAVMGLFQYYMRYVPEFAAIARPITDLTKKGAPFSWSPACERAFQRLKAELTAPGRVLRNPDFNRPFILHTDFSNRGISAVLSQQGDDGREYMVAAISRSLNAHERVYSPYQGELLAVIWAVKSFHLYLHGSRFTIYTDHQPLQWLFSRNDLTGQSARWVLFLQEYEFSVVHRAGKANGNADALSRMPLPAGAQAPQHPNFAASVQPQATTPSRTAFVRGMVQQAAVAAGISTPAPTMGLPATLQSTSAATCPDHWHVAAHQRGVVIVDLCGGIATTLDALLQLGYYVQAYAYSDVDPIAQRAATHRVQQLRSRFPHLTSLEVGDLFLHLLPQDVNDISSVHLQALTERYPSTPLLLVCGWPCQDLSPAGSHLGLEGARSSLIHLVLPLLQHLISQHTAPVAYILENAATEQNFRSEQIRGAASQQLRALLGPSVVLDAVACGSYAHRLRAFWTNLADATALQSVLQHLQPPYRDVQTILDPGRTTRPAAYGDKHPFFPINQAGERIRVLPTLVSHPNSYSFRDGKQGMLRTAAGALEQPNVAERERAMGLRTGDTAAAGLTAAERHSLTGRSIDLFCLVTLFHATAVVQTGQLDFTVVSQVRVAAALPDYPYPLSPASHLPFCPRLTS